MDEWLSVTRSHDVTAQSLIILSLLNEWDEWLSVTRSNNVTIQNSIMSEPLNE